MEMMDEPNSTEPTTTPGKMFSPPPGPGMVSPRNLYPFSIKAAGRQAFTDASPTTRAPSISSIITDFHTENNVWDNDPFTDAFYMHCSARIQLMESRFQRGFSTER